MTGKLRAKFWFGLGASAGGLEALRGFARNLPDGLDATYIVAQHMAPNFKSMLSEIIGRETIMPVLEVSDGLVPERNTIYIAPPNTNMIVEKGKIRLVEPGNKPGSPKPSVSLFFKSLAAAKKQFAIGAVLSGTGADGADGIRAIREAGGITIAQDEHTARYASMPSAAMETGCVDLVMSPEELGTQFPKIIDLPRNLEALRASPLSLDSVAELIKLLNEQTRVNFRHYKSATLQRRIERRMAACKVKTLEDYVQIAKGSREEVQLLFKDLLISVTSFFRDAGEFEAIKVHIDALVEAKASKPIRIWIAGTATGEEAYSLAILFAEACGGPSSFQNKNIQFFATDIDSDAIEVARRGFYSEAGLSGQVPEEYISKYFDKVPSGYTVKKFVREKVLFSVHNTVNDPPFLNLDFISCRNLLIYFQSSLQTEAFSRFHYSLVPNGILFLGKSEAISASETLFRVADDEKHIFFQRPSEKRRALRAHLYERTEVQPRTPSIERTNMNIRDLGVAKARFESLVKALGPNAILINSEMQVITAYGNVDRYLGLTAGAIDTNATSLLREPYRYEVRLSAPGVLRKGEPYFGIPKKSSEHEGIKESTAIYPLSGGSDEEPMALIVFQEFKDKSEKRVAESEDSTTESRKRIEELEAELKIARSNLEQIAEELETSNEELQSSNEELQSANEELQSTNEELETSNEELQSTNEELSTVNEELQVNAQQLNAVNQSLQSILENIAVPLLVVDHGLHITNASRASETVFGTFADLSMPHIGRCRLPDGYPDLEAVVKQSINNGVRQDIAVVNSSTTATLTIVPHVSSAGVPLGAIVMVTDDTEKLERARNQLELIFDNVPIGILVRDQAGVVLRSNALADTYLGRNIPMSSTSFYDGMDKAICESRRKIDESIISTGEPNTAPHDAVPNADGQMRWIRNSHILGRHPERDEPAIYTIAQDITEAYATETALAESQKRIDQAVNVAGIAFWDWKIIEDTLFLSDRFYEMMGTSKKDRNKLKSFADTIHTDDRERVISAYKQHLEKDEPFDLAFRLVTKGKVDVWVEANGQVFLDDYGQPNRFLGAVQDVTEKRANIYNLQDRTEQLAAAAKLSGLGYWTLNLKTDEVFWSDEVYTIHGISPDNYVPKLKTAVEFYHPEDVDRVQEMVSRAIDTGELWEFEARIVRPSGEQRTVHSACAPSMRPGAEAEEIFGVFWDVTDDRRKEEKLRQTLTELSRSNEELNRFSYVCSHDMKEPVRMIEAMADLLVEPNLDLPDEKRAELLSRISNNTKRLRGIIDSLLAYSRINASVGMDDIHLDKLMVEILEGLALVIEEKNASISIGKLPVLFGAKVHFLQLLQNLVGNSLKFNDKDKPRIKVSSRKRANDYVILVEDNGPGIPVEARDEIFGLFRRLKRRDEVEGTGLGLSIAQKIVEQYNGQIRCVDSKLGGVGFEIVIPNRAKNDE